MPRIPPTFLLAGLVAGLPAVSARAADPIPAPGAPAADGGQPLPPVVVEASRLSAEAGSIGSAATVRGADELAQGQYLTLTDALQEVPGVTVMRSGGPGNQTSVFMRGTDSGHTLLLLDGVRAVDTASPNGLAAWDHLLLTGVDRLEVLAGPQGPLYGSDTIGGVVAASTPRGRGPATGFTGFEFGSRNTSLLRVSGQGGDERFGWFVGGSHYDTLGFSQAANNGERDDYRNSTLATRLVLDPSETTPWGGEFVLRHARSYLDFDDESGFSADPSLLHTDADVTLAKLAPRWLLADGMVEQSLNLNYFESTRKSKAHAFDFGYPSDYTGKAWGADFQNLVHLHRTLDVVAGAEYRLEKAANSGAVSTFDAENGVGALYAQAQWRPLKPLALNLGGRLEDHQSFGTHATWKLGAAYDLERTDTTLRGAVGTGFNAPTLAQLYDTTFGTNNPALEPEESTSYEAGADQRFLGAGRDARLTVSGTWFRNEIDQLIVFGPAFTLANAREARTQGVEAAASWLALRGGASGDLKLTGAYTYTDAIREDTDQDLLRRPHHQASLRLDYVFPGEGASIGVAARYLGKRLDVDPATFATVQADDRLTFDLVGRMTFCPGVNLTARIENLFDDGKPEVLGFNPTPFGVFAGVEITLR